MISWSEIIQKCRQCTILLVLYTYIDRYSANSCVNYDSYSNTGEVFNLISTIKLTCHVLLNSTYLNRSNIHLFIGSYKFLQLVQEFYLNLVVWSSLLYYKLYIY